MQTRFRLLLVIPIAIFSMPLLQPAISGAALADELNAALTVSVVAPKRDDWPVVVPASGWLKPWQEAVIASEIGGQRIKMLNVDVGAHVTKGQVLAELTSDTIENDIKQQQAVIDSDQAALIQATEDAARADLVTGTGALSQQSIAEYEITQQKAQATLEAAEAVLASYQLQLRQTQVLAVDDGVISSRSASLGEVVSVGTELFRLIRQDRIEWQAEVALRYLPLLRITDNATIPTPLGDVHGTIRVISPSASTANGRVLVYVALTPPDGAPDPKTNIFVSGRFELSPSPALTVPSTAVVLRDGFSYVFTLAAGDKVARQRVQTGRRRGDRIEILDGLVAGAKVVVAGGAFLADGSLVKVVTTQAGGADQ